MNKILIGSDEGTYTVTNGARTITLLGLSFIPMIEQLAYVYNKTQDKLYYAPGVGIAKCSLTAGVVTIDSSFPVLVTGDILHIQMFMPQRAFDVSLDGVKSIVQNPEYAHTTSVETLADESALPGIAPTADAGGTATQIVDADGAFTAGNTAVGYTAYNITDNTNALVTAWVSGTQVNTGAGVVSWASDVYRLPTIRRYEINMDTYKNLSVHHRMTCGATSKAYLKIYGTLDATATVDSDTNWVDMTLALFGAAAGYVCDGIIPGALTSNENLTRINDCTMLKYMIKLVVEDKAAPATGNIFKVYIKKS